MTAATPPRTERAHRLRGAALLAAAGVALACVEAVQTYLGRPAHERTDRFAVMLLLMLPPWLILAALAPGPVALARRLAARGTAPFPAVVAHAGAAAAFAVAHHALLATFHHVAYGDPRPIPALTRWLLGHYFLADVATYAALAGATHARVAQAALRRREVDAAALRAELAEARLRGLRGQLHPHFLFNALHTVAMLARAGETRTVVSVVTALSGLLRAVLRETPADETPLAEELAFAERYLAVEQARFRDRLRVRWDVEPAARERAVPVLLLQPLVENVIHHALARVSRPVELTVRARVAGDALQVEVCDDGPGLPPGWSLERDGGVGLRNTRERLARLYGGAGAIAVTAREEGGVRVAVTVPRPLPRADAA